MNIKKLISLLILVIMFSSLNFAADASIRTYYDDDLALYGIKDASGQTILKATYEYMSDFVDGYAIVEKDNMTGAIDEKGKLIIPLEYEGLSYFIKGNALAAKNNKIGIISKDNTIVHEFIWDEVNMIEYSSNYNTFVFKKGDLYGVANFDGTILLNEVKARLSHISDTSVAFSNGDTVGVMDFNQKIIVKEEFDSVYATKSGYIAEKNYSYQFLDEKGNPLNDIVYSNAELLKNDLYIVSIDNENDEETYGVYNVSTGSNVLAMAYDYISLTENNYDNDKEYLTLSIYGTDGYYDTKNGLADLDGNIIIEAKYSTAEFITKDLVAYSDSDYNTGIYSLKTKLDTGIKYANYSTTDDNKYLIIEDLDGKYGLIDNDLKYVILPESDYIYKSASLYVSEKGDKVALYNPLTKKLSDYKYDEFFGFKSVGDKTISAIKYNGKFGMIDENASFFIPPVYDELGEFNEGYAIISQSGLYGFIDNNGKIFIEPKYEMLNEFTNGFSIYKLDGKFGYLNKSGNIAISAKFDSASAFDESGYATVGVGEKVGVIDKSGRYTIKANYSDIYKLNKTLVVIVDSKTGLLGIAEASGKIIIDTNCNEIGYFSNENATYIKVNSQYALINAKAEIISTFDFDYMSEFNGSFADIEIGEKKGFINIRGEYILE
ncbi:MAG: WG repeat-containing protein [Acidaminobacteraceae bacterium]